jgi:hypothetical protein
LLPQPQEWPLAALASNPALAQDAVARLPLRTWAALLGGAARSIAAHVAVVWAAWTLLSSALACDATAAAVAAAARAAATWLPR